MKKQFATVATVCTLALSCAAQAQQTTPTAGRGLRPVVGASVTGGGETLATVEYTNGSTQKIRSGGLVHLFGGAEYDAEAFAVQANIGFHVDDTNAKDGSIKFSRWPVELIGFWKASPQIRLGLGVRKATNVKVTSSGKASSFGSQDFDSKAGLLLQGEYLFMPNLSGLLRLVSEEYRVGNTKVDGNHIGLGVSYRF